MRRDARPSFRTAARFGFCLWVFALLGCQGPAGQGSGSPSEVGSQLRVVATTGMVADMVRQVAQDRVELVTLMGAGVDPHLYRPTVRDIRELSQADMVFYNGLMLEGRMQESLQRVAKRGRNVFAVAESLPLARLLSPPEFAGHPDPHVWMDVGLWRDCVRQASELLVRHDPSAAEGYRRRAEEYQRELQRLDDYVRQVIGSIPVERRVLVTAHDAFGYFSRAYGIPVRSAQGISTESEPGVNDINELVDFLVERRVPAIFVESSVSQANLLAVVEGAASKGSRVAIGGELFSDALGPAGTYEGTYVGMLDHNATTIARSLGGEAPAAGLNGRLQIVAPPAKPASGP